MNALYSFSKETTVYGAFNKTSLMSPGCRWVLPDGVFWISRLIIIVCHYSFFLLLHNYMDYHSNHIINLLG